MAVLPPLVGRFWNTVKSFHKNVTPKKIKTYIPLKRFLYANILQNFISLINFLAVKMHLTIKEIAKNEVLSFASILESVQRNES